MIVHSWHFIVIVAGVVVFGGGGGGSVAAAAGGGGVFMCVSFLLALLVWDYLFPVCS